MPRATSCVEGQRTAQQRAPRQLDGDEVGDPGQLGGERLGGRRDEQGVGRPPRRGGSGGTTGRLGHGVGAGVDADDERARVGGRGGQHEPSVAGAQVDHDPGGAGAPGGELADVHLVDALADHDAHARTLRDGRRTRNGLADRVRREGSPTLRAMSELPIRPYERQPAAFHPWDPRTADVARDVARLVESARPGTHAQHVGSSSVPGMPGKNVVDLGVEATPDDIPDIVDALLSLGFQRQGGLAPFPPTRPLVLGNVDHDGTSYRIHLHVMPPARHELRRAARLPRRAARGPRRCATATRRRSGSSSSRRPTATRTSCTRSTRATSSRTRCTASASAGRRPTRRSRSRPAPRSGSSAAGSSGRMLGIAARAMGYRIVALDPDPACPTAAVADEIVVGAYDDPRRRPAAGRGCRTS